ncbi:MAG: serine hydrolase [Candidatus Aminicenantes bacterium]
MRRGIVKWLHLFIILCFVFSPLAALEEPEKADLEGLDQFIKDRMEEWKVPGLAISVVKEGKVIYSEGFGLRNVEQELEVTPRTLFAIGSCSKAFTAVAMGILVDEGKLDWDNPVREYLPAFELKDLFASQRMTPRDLACHRSGLPRHDLMWYSSPFSRSELFDRLKHLEPSEDFRTTFQYQNLMFMTAGYLVGQITGSTWEDFVKERIFDPLGMKDSNFSVEDSKKADDFALPYLEHEEQVMEIPFRNIDNVGPAGSINSNVEEMANWVLLNLNKGKFGENQIISENNLQEVHSPQMISSKNIRYDELFYSTYGMGWSINSYRGHLMLTHGGGIDGFSALVSLMPRHNIGLVILTNLNGCPVPSIVAYNVCDRLLGLDQVPWNKRIKEQIEKAEKEVEEAEKEKDKDRVPNTQPSHPLEDYAGDYRHPGYGVIAVKKDGDLLKTVFNSIESELHHYHYDVFELKNEVYEFFGIKQKLSFFADDRGRIARLSIQLEPAVDPILFTKMAEKKMMEKSFLQKFEGEYVLGETTVNIKLKGEDTLILTVPGQPDYELIPYEGTEFKLKGLTGYSLEFVVDERGEVTEAKFKQPQGVVTAKKK